MIKLNLTLLLLISSSKVLLASSQKLECEFTEDFCDWNDQEVTGWNLGEYGEVGFGKPAKRIENGGGFIYTQSPTKTSVLESPIFPNYKEPFCLIFNYFMFGLSVGSLELQLESVIGDDVSKFNQNGQRVWRQEGSKYDDWILGKYYFDPSQHNGDMFRLKFVATSDDIALGSILVKPGSCDFDYKCDFENPSLCFWKSEPDYNSNLRWIVSNGSNSQLDLVGFDATTHSAAGHFMRTHSNGFGSSSSDLISTNYLSSSEAKCLSFQVFKQQFDSDLLQFAIKSESGSRSAVWFQSYIVNQRWVKVNLDIPIQSDPFKLILSAHHHTEKSAPIALDELTVSPQPCSSLGSCNFDSGLCSYTIKSGELLVGFGRLPDPTTINWTPIKNIDPYDLFVYTNTKKNNDSAVYSLESPYIEQTIGKTCLTFSFALTFLQKGTFLIKLTSGDSSDSKTIWSLDPPVSEETWKTIQVPLPYSDKFYKYSFEFSGVQLFAAIDDIVLHSCNTQQETPVCSYDGLVDQDCIEIVPSAFNNWFFKKTSQLGNSLDPAYKFKNDLVLLFDEPVSAQISSFSHFYVPNLKSDVSYCLNFWYLINGNIQLSLWTDKVDSNFDQHLRKTPIVTLNSHSVSSWAQAKIPLDDIFADSKLIFGAGYAVNSQGTIAIDGLELNEGICSFDYFCDFEDSCSWNNLGKDKSLTLTGSGITYKSTTEWIKVNAKNAGPDRDATLGSRDGHFLTLKSINENAILTLPPFYLYKNTAEMCFSVKTYTSGQSTIEIISEQGGVFKLIEQKSMNSMNWELFQAVIKLDPNLSKVGHVHIVGSGRLAIDDVSIKQGSCPIAGPIFTCKNGKQISTLQVCDFISDCPSEGEDEHNCGGCYFSYDLCGYTHDNNAEWFNENGKANAKSSDFGKTHTKLTSPTLRPTAPNCRLQFGYEHKANDLTVLLVFQDGRTVEVWTNKMLTDWTKGTVEIKLGRIPIPFAIQFYSVLRNYFLVKDTTSFGPVQFIDCGYQDTVDSFASSEIYTCKNGRRINQDEMCDQSIDCFDGDDEFNCENHKIYSFEDSRDANDWTNLSNNNIKWSLVKASGQISSTPPRDHSTGLENGGYMAIYPLHDQHSDFSSAKEVSLVGPRLTSDDNCFMVFYYNTAGVDLIVSVIDNNSRIQKLLEIPTDLVFGFKRAIVKLRKGTVSGVFRFVFTAKYSASIKLNYSEFRNPWARVSDNYYAAVDDIVISGSCLH